MLIACRAAFGLRRRGDPNRSRECPGWPAVAIGLARAYRRQEYQGKRCSWCVLRSETPVCASC